MKNIKRIYLIIIGIMTILSIVLLSTKALFVNVTENNNNVTMKPTLSYMFNVNSNQQFTLPANTAVRFDAVITNEINDGAIYYELWYKMISPTTKPNTVLIAEITEGDLTTSGNLEVGTENSNTVSIVIKNDGTSEITLKIGMAAGYVGREIIYTEDEILITEKTSPELAPEETWSVGENCEKKITIEKVNGENKAVEKILCPTGIENADITGASAPDLFEGLIPVKWDSNDKLVKADIKNPSSNVWYNYDEKMWANAVMVSSGTRSTYMNASVGRTINESDILAYFVWIPRYSYELFNVDFTSGTNPRTINISFESASEEKKTGSTNGEYLTHPAFTFGNTELNGFWIGKFETSSDDSCTPTINDPLGTGCNVTNLNPRIVPNVTPWRGIQTATMYQVSKKMGMTSYLMQEGVEKVDSHMLKNIEWGAVALLSHSAYGINQEIYMNNATSYITGRSGGSVGGVAINTYGNYTYDGKVVNTDGTIGSYASDKSLGTKASTTGNIYGVYDMSGSAWEIVMGNLEGYVGQKIENNYHSGFNGKLYSGEIITAGFTYPEDKYVDIYENPTDVITDISGSKLGDAMGEAAAWYGDSVEFVYSYEPWLARGGQRNVGALSGIFSFAPDYGHANVYLSFRIALTAK